MATTRSTGDGAAAAKTSTYTVLSKVKHEGKLYRKDRPIELTDKHAKPLLAVKAIEPKK